jgi:SAM-dependent methyltransferase
MPPDGKTLIDIGAGFGRLADEYDGYDRIVLFDYSRSLLLEARAGLGPDPRFVYVAGDWYRMPFVDGLFETMVQVRTIHHTADVPALFQQLARIAHPAGSYVLEFASKHHLKAIIRYWLKRQSWSPFLPEPVEFVALNFDFHPRWIGRQLEAVGFSPQRMLTVSHFRLPLLKRLIPTRILVALDRMAQLTGDLWQLTPSVFVGSGSPPTGKAAEDGRFFACPDCGTPLGDLEDSHLICSRASCGKRYSFSDGVYNFKEPV